MRKPLQYEPADETKNEVGKSELFTHKPKHCHGLSYELANNYHNTVINITPPPLK